MWIRPAIIVVITVALTVTAGLFDSGSSASADEPNGPGGPAAPSPTIPPITPPPSLCSDDASEQNDTQGTARPVALPYSDAGLRVCPNDDDWFSFSVPIGAQIYVDALFVDANGDVDIYLYRPDGALADFSTSTSDNESLGHTATMSGDYAVKVVLFGATPVNGNAYTLQITTSCPDDAFEDNDTQPTAFGVTLPFSQAGLRACPVDDDWFSFPVSAGDQIQIDAVFSHADGNVNMHLSRADGTEVDFSASVTDGESISHTATTSGDYAVRVELEGAVPPGGNSYALQINVTTESTPTPTLTGTPTETPTSTPTTPTPLDTPANTPSPTATGTTPLANTPTLGPPAGLPGDVDCNDVVNSLDALLLLQYAAGLLSSLPCPGNADVNTDGNIDPLDAQLILQYGAGLIPSLPP